MPRLQAPQLRTKARNDTFWTVLTLIAAAAAGVAGYMLTNPPAKHEAASVAAPPVASQSPAPQVAQAPSTQTLAPQVPAHSAPARPMFPEQPAARNVVTVDFGDPAENVRAPAYPDAFDVKLAGPNTFPPMQLQKISERKLRAGIKAETEKLFLARDFDGLEALAQTYRTKDRLTPAGQFKSQYFYEPFEDCHCEHGGRATAEWLVIAQAWRAARPQSVTALMAEALLMEDDAWRMRGGEFANKTPPARAAAFHQRIDETQRFLAANWTLAKQDPHAYAVWPRIGRALAANRGEFDTVMEMIADEAPDYTPAWYTGSDYGADVWLHNPDYVERIAEQAADATKARLGDSMYARVLMHAWSRGSPGIFREARIDRERLRRGIHDVVSRYPDKHNFVSYAQLSCELEEWDTAAQLIARMQVLAVESFGEFPQYVKCRRDLYYRQQ